MKHAYLTESAIKEALKAKAITETEAAELSQTLERCERIVQMQQAKLKIAS